MPIKTTRSVPSKGTRHNPAHWAPLALVVAFLPAAAFAETRDQAGLGVYVTGAGSRRVTAA